MRKCIFNKSQYHHKKLADLIKLPKVNLGRNSFNAYLFEKS
jgi:hypothetical protein